MKMRENSPMLCINLNEKVVNVGFYVSVIRQEVRNGQQEKYFAQSQQQTFKKNSTIFLLVSLKNTLFSFSLIREKGCTARRCVVTSISSSECAKTLITVCVHQEGII